MAVILNADNGVVSGISGLTTTADNSGVLQFQSSGTNTLTITAAGNVGVGTASPPSVSNYRFITTQAATGAVYQAYGASSTDARIFADNAYGGAGMFSNHPFLFYTNSSERMRIDSSGNVGIGTSSPNTKLEVVGAVRATNSGSSGYFYRGYRSGTTSAWYVYDSGTEVQMTVEQANPLLFGTSNTERMRIDSAGNVGIGITNPAYQLQLSGGTTVTSRVQLNRGTDDTNQNLRLGWNSIKTTRSNVALSGTQTNLDFVQVGSDGERTAFSMGTNGSLEVNYGIKFPASQQASTDANTLDDYEEGTWTPSFGLSSGSVTYSSQTGTYTKIGRMVTVVFNVTVNTSSTGVFTQDINGLPFTGANTNFAGTAMSFFGAGLFNNYANIIGLVGSTGVGIQLRGTNNAAVAPALVFNGAIITNGTQVAGTCTYFTS